MRNTTSKFRPNVPPKTNTPKRVAGAKAAQPGLRNIQRAAAAPAPVDDDPVPENIDEFRRELTRRIINFLGGWRQCREPLCKRSKRCAGADLRCQRDRSRPKLTHEEQSRVMSHVRRLIERRMKEQEGK